jgi:predicted metal-dependent phosphoesterase TrpH
MLCCDLHIHTSFSRDGESTVEEILKQAVTAGLDAIAITDHDTVEGALYAMRCQTPLVIIPGIEVSTRQGHLIALGITEPIPRGMDFLQTATYARKLGAVVVLPHPFHQWRHGAGLKVRTAVQAVDAVEVFNSRYIIGSANRKAVKKAARLGKPQVGGSDAHNARFVGYGLTFVDAEPDVSSILEAIREGRTIVGGRMTPLRTYTRQSFYNAMRRIRTRVRR